MILQNFRKTRVTKKVSEYKNYLRELFSLASSKILQKDGKRYLEAVP